MPKESSQDIYPLESFFLVTYQSIRPGLLKMFKSVNPGDYLSGYNLLYMSRSIISQLLLVVEY